MQGPENPNIISTYRSEKSSHWEVTCSKLHKKIRINDSSFILFFFMKYLLKIIKTRIFLKLEL